MKSGLLRFGFFLIIICLAVIGLASPVRAESFARISDIHESLNLKGNDEGDWTQATLNLLLREGDRLETRDDGTAEIEMPGLSRIRMGDQTEIRIKGYGGSNSRDEVVLEKGGIFVDDRDGTTVIETPSAAVSPNSGSAVRVDVDRDGTRVRVAAGSAQVQTFEDDRYTPRPMLLRSGEEMILDLNARPEGPYSYHAANDTLDRYWQEREKELGRVSDHQNKEQNLDQPLMGSAELDQYGEWVTVNSGPVWRPHVAADWRPYYNGYWAWYDPYGWTWISYDPFGYVTFHYGAWIYDPFYGWCWAPGYVWRPAYVSWFAVGPYFAWAPLDPWGGVVFINIDVVFVNGLDSRVFTIAPRTAFVIDHRAIRPGGRRVIPAGIKTNASIRVAEKRLFKEHPRVERIRDFNTVQPVRIESDKKLERKALVAPGEHLNRADFPKPGRMIPRETEAFKRGHGSTLMPEKRLDGEKRGFVERRDSPARTPPSPRVSRPERQSSTGEIRHEAFPRADQRVSVYERTIPRQEPRQEHRNLIPEGFRVERRPGFNTGGIPPAIEHRSNTGHRTAPAPEERRIMNPPGAQPSIPNTIFSHKNQRPSNRR